MQLAKVIGSVAATVKDKSLEGMKLLMIQPLDHKMRVSCYPIAAVDVAQAGPGDLVYWITAREASLALPKPFAPVDASIVGIVDEVNEEERGILEKSKIFDRFND